MKKFKRFFKMLFKKSDYCLGYSKPSRPFPMQSEVGDYNSHLDFLEMYGIIDEEREARFKKEFDERLKKLGLQDKTTLTARECQLIFDSYKKDEK